MKWLDNYICVFLQILTVYVRILTAELLTMTEKPVMLICKIAFAGQAFICNQGECTIENYKLATSRCLP
jgi:hypothetical protein